MTLAEVQQAIRKLSRAERKLLAKWLIDILDADDPSGDQGAAGLTVGQLIEQLHHHPGHWPVVVQGYEDGYDPITDVQRLKIAPTPERVGYRGVYEQVEGTGEEALLLSSKYNRTDVEDEAQQARSKPNE